MADPNKLPTIWDDPFGTLSPSAGTQEVFGALADALSGVKRRQAAMYPWQIWQTQGVRTDGQIVPGGPAGKIGPPTPPHPLSTMGLLNTAVGFTPYGAMMDLAEAYDTASHARNQREMASAVGRGLLAASGLIPGGRMFTRPAHEVAKLTEATRMAEKAGLATDAASRARRMIEQGYTPDYWRGGKSVADGPWYTPSAEAAGNYARRHRDQADVRKYALDEKSFLKFEKGYGPDLFQAIAKEMESYNPAAAKEWRKMAAEGDVVSGASIWQMLQHTSNGPEALLRKIGFTGVKSAPETRVLDMSVVRDQEAAMFHPGMKGKVNPFYGMLPFAGGAGIFGTGRNDDDRP